MLTAVKNQVKVSLLSLKYSIMREMLNKVTFLSNVIFMMLNNASFLVQWIILFALKDNIGGNSMHEVFLLWGLAASTYGVARFFFLGAFDLSELITDGKLDCYLVQPKDVLISIITSKSSSSALGDLLYGYVMLAIYGIDIKIFALFTLFSICGGLILVGMSVFYSSLGFWFTRTEALTDQVNTLMVNFATYPEGIFKGITKGILFTLIPVGIVNYLPIRVMKVFDLKYTLIVIAVTIVIILAAYVLFNRGLKKYSSSNLMSARV